MTIDTIKTRIENGQKKLAKLEAKMARIKKAQASNWENNPYYYSENDIKWTQRDIDEQKASIEKYQKMLGEETDKAASRNVPVLVEFLNMWKDNAAKWYNDKRSGEDRVKAHKAVEHAKKIKERFDHDRWTKQSELDKQIAAEIGTSSEYAKEVYNDSRSVKLRAMQDKKSEKLEKAYEDAWRYYKDNFGDIDDMESEAYYVVHQAEMAKIEAQCKKEHKKFRSWDYHIELTKTQKNKAWNEYLEKILNKEWNRKYDRLLDDVIRITGTIDDASGLRVNEKGDLDGYIVGKKGTAKINTFGAGGYNIQCFHYRTKITKVKESVMVKKATERDEFSTSLREMMN